MGLTADCPQCRHSESSDSHRGGRIGACPRCGTRMRAATAGKAEGRCSCLVANSLITLGLGGAQLGQPMRLAATGLADEFMRAEREQLDRSDGQVHGPGCVVHGYLAPEGHPWKIALVPAPDAGPATWIVTERLQYRKCRGCGASIVASAGTLMDREWRPARDRPQHRPGPAPGRHVRVQGLPRRREPAVLTR
jgi:hypothetical protein